MEDAASFNTILTTANFGARSRTAITEFYCENLTELAQLPSKDLDTSIGILHKALANHATSNRIVRLNAV